MATAKKINKKTKTEKPVVTQNSWQLLKSTWFELSTFWRPIAGVTAVYAVLYFLFVMGLGFASVLQVQDGTGNTFTDAMYAIFGSINDTYVGGASDATTLLQYVLFMVASLALIWLLRKLQALKKVTIRDAYYQGTAGIVPVILVSVILIFCFIPAALGSTLVSTAMQASSAMVEIIVITAVSGILLLGSLWLFAMFWPAFYIASLPQTRPIQALRSARVLTKKRRFSILRKFIVLGLLLAFGIFIVLLPVALLLPVATPYVAYILLFVAFAFMQVYLYQLYRSLL